MEAERIGYLHDNFKLFHIKEQNRKTFDFHYHDFHKILFLVQGVVSYNVEGNIYSLRPMDLVLVNHGEIHCPVIDDNCIYERYVLYISPTYLSTFSSDNYSLDFCFQSAKKERSHVFRLPKISQNMLLEKLQKLEAAFQTPGYAHELLEENAFVEFLVECNRAIIAHPTEFINQKTYSMKMAPIIDYINEHLSETLSLEHIADQFFLSKSYLMHSFKDETGYTIGNYISTKRLFLARDLISKGYSVTEACFQCGFQNYTTFSRAYKKTFHEPPRLLK